MRGDDVLVLIAGLCRSLDAEGVRYCHWKSNEAIARSANGENDLDLLVHRSDAERFEGILRKLGFKDTVQPGWKQLPGVYHSYGLDPPTGALVHIHAHYQLVVGDDMTKNIHLPIEESYLASSTPDQTFMIPSPAFELAVFLIRMTVKHCTWDAFVTLQGSLSRSERRELDDLLGHVDLDDVWALTDEHFPFISRELWARCLRSVKPGSSRWFRIVTASRLQRTLGGWSRRAAACRHLGADVAARPDPVPAEDHQARSGHESPCLRWCADRHRGRGRGRQVDRRRGPVALALLRAHRLPHDAHGEAQVVPAHRHRQGPAEAGCRHQAVLHVLGEGAQVLPRRCGRGQDDAPEPRSTRVGGAHRSRPLPHLSEGEAPRIERLDRSLRPLSVAAGLADGRCGDRSHEGTPRAGADGRDRSPPSSGATTNGSRVPTS